MNRRNTDRWKMLNKFVYALECWSEERIPQIKDANVNYISFWSCFLGHVVWCSGTTITYMTFFRQHRLEKMLFRSFNIFSANLFRYFSLFRIQIQSELCTVVCTLDSYQLHNEIHKTESFDRRFINSCNERNQKIGKFQNN